jgi:beta-aspartyl-peptidase (threonine type)
MSTPLPHRRLRPAPSLPWIIATVALAALVSAVRPGRTGAADDEAASAVRRLLDRQVDDWNRKDLDAFLEGYWHAPGVVFQSGSTRFDGFEAMRQRYRDRYQAGGREMGKLVFSGLDVIVLAPDAALARGRWQLTMSDGQRPGGLFTLLLRKLPEGWRIVHDHTSS